MSILRNQRGQASNTVTVKRFLDDTAFATRKRGNVTYSFYSREWVGLNNYYLVDDNLGSYNHLGFNRQSTIVIRCTLATDAVGPLFGVTGKARVMCEGGNIKWYDDSGTVVHTVAIDGKRHDIGVYTDNNTLKPFYDGAVTANAMTSQGTERDFYPCSLSTDAANGTVTGVCLSSATATYAIKIHEIGGTFVTRASNDKQSKAFRHFYACNSNASETVPHMFETRAKDIMVLQTTEGSAITGVTAARGLGEHVTYGVQLHDLQEAFGSYYKQLIAILCEDGGVDRGGAGTEQYYAGWDDPKGINGDEHVNADTKQIVVVGEDTYNSAFRLNANALPSGAVITNPSGSYDDGDLIRGRKPKWNLWADNVGAFRYVKTINVGVYGHNYGYQMLYNIYKDFYGENILSKDDKDMLAVFDGYSTRMVTWHAPRLEVTGIPVIYTYNGLAYIKDQKNMYTKDLATVQTNAYAFNSADGDGTVKAVLGNLPYWTLTAAQQAANMKVYGLAVRGMYRDSNGYFDIFTMVKTESAPLSADSSDAVKTLYKTTGETANMRVTALTDSARIFADNGVFKTYYTLGMMKSQSSIISDVNVIDCSRLVPAVKGQSLVYQSYSNLMLIGQKNYDGKVIMDGNPYDIYVSQATADNDNISSDEVVFNITKNPIRNGVGFKFALLDENRNTQALYTNGVSKFYAYIEYIRMASDKSFILLNDTSYRTVDSKNDLPQGQDTYNNNINAYIVRQGRKVFRRVASAYNEVNVVSFPTLNDFPSDRIVYKTTYDAYDETYVFGNYVFIYIWNQYINSREYTSYSAYRTRVYKVTSASAWPTASDAQSALVYYKAYGDDDEDERYYIYRGGDYVKATVVHVPNKESLPEIGDYYEDASTGKIYWNNWTPSTNPFYKNYANDYVEMTKHPSASKPTGSGSAGAHIYYAQDSEKYYDYGYGSGGHYRYHEDDVVIGTKPTTGETGKIYKDGGHCYRYANNAWVEISPWYERGEVIERRAMFADTFAFDRTVWPLYSSYAHGIIKDDDTLYINKGTSKNVDIDDNTKYAAALFYDQDLRQNSVDTPLTSRYNDFDATSQPRAMVVRLFEKATAPHAWCVKDAYMSDKVENWMFSVGNFTIQSASRECCYFLLSRNEEEEYLIPYGNYAVVQAALGLCYKGSTDYESYADLESTAANFKRFKFSLYKQSATHPYVMNGNTPTFDSTHNTTTLFENLNISTANTEYTSGNYTVKVTPDRYLEGFRMNAAGTMKNGIFNDTCYYLEVTCSTTPEAGATYLMKITPY